MKKSRIYTRTGDQGTTSLVGGERVPKTHYRLEAYGTIDELNAQIGLLLTYLSEDDTSRSTLLAIQNILFVMGAQLATADDSGSATVLTFNMVDTLEKAIDEIDSQLPPLHAFVLPGGCSAAAQCHVCRTICRRAERCVLTLAQQVVVSPEITAYLNRLSDYFFVLSRKMNQQQGMQEIFWQKPC